VHGLSSVMVERLGSRVHQERHDMRRFLLPWLDQVVDDTTSRDEALPWPV